MTMSGSIISWRIRISLVRGSCSMMVALTVVVVVVISFNFMIGKGRVVQSSQECIAVIDDTTGTTCGAAH